MKSLKELKKENKFKLNKYLFILLCFLILSVTVGYSALQQVLEISGKAAYRVPGIMRITNLSLDSTSNGGIEEYSSNYFKDSIKIGISLPNKNSTITYKVQLSNLGSVDELVEKIDSNIDSSIINYTIDGLNIYEDVLEKCGTNNDVATKEFNITFKYNDNFDFSTVSNEIGVNRTIYDITLSFTFKNATPLMDSRFDAIDFTGYNGWLFSKLFSKGQILYTLQDMIENQDNYTFYNSNIKISEIESISFSNSLKLPDNVIGYTNISSDGIVLLSYTDLDNNGLYEITISGYNGVILPSNSTGLFMGLSNAKSINFNTGINSSKINEMNLMFAGCDNLINLDIQNIDSNNITGLYLAFMNCSNIESLNLSNLGTGNTKIMSGLFNNCTNLKSVDLSGKFNTFNVEFMDLMFSNCSSIESLDLGNFFTINLQNISYMFSGCKLLMNVDLRSFDTSNVVLMEGVFSYCESLYSVDLSNFNTSKVSSLNSMFNGCKSLIGTNVSNFNTSNVTNMANMFSNCSSLQNLDLSSFDTSNVDAYNNIFGGCSNLRYLDISNFNVKENAELNLNNAFRDLRLKELYITKWDFSRFDLLEKFSTFPTTTYVNKKYQSLLDSKYSNKNIEYVEV